MKKVYLIFLSLLSTILLLTLFFFYSISQKQLNSKKRSLSLQGNQCVAQMEKLSFAFENQINYILYHDSITAIFDSPSNGNPTVNKLELLYTAFPNLISNITIFDKNKQVFSLLRDKYENYITDIYAAQSQKNYIKKKPLIMKMNSTS